MDKTNQPPEQILHCISKLHIKSENAEPCRHLTDKFLGAKDLLCKTHISDMYIIVNLKCRAALEILYTTSFFEFQFTINGAFIFGGRKNVAGSFQQEKMQNKQDAKIKQFSQNMCNYKSQALSTVEFLLISWHKRSL